MRELLFMFPIFIVVSCSEPAPEVPPSDLMDKEKFTEVMVDVQLIEGMKIHKLGPKRAKSPDMESMYSEIFQNHNISQSEFQKTYDYYKARPNQMELIYEQVLDSLSKLDVEVKKIYNAPKHKSDTLKLDSITQSAQKKIKLMKSELNIPTPDSPED